MYKITKTIYGDIIILRKNEDGTVTSFGEYEANSDYQQYLVDTDGGLPTPKQTEGE